MTVSHFPDPFVHRVWRRCRRCETRVEVILVAGASCPRDPYYTCAHCLEVPEATPARLALLDASSAPQLLQEGDRG